MSKKSFRALVLISVFLYALLILLSIALPDFASTDMREAYLRSLNSGFYGHTYPLFDVISIATIIVLAIAVYGLYFFRKWAPPFTLIATFISFLPYFLVLSHLNNSLHMIVLACMDLVWGAILMIVFLNPYSDWFKKSPPSTIS